MRAAVTRGAVALGLALTGVVVAAGPASATPAWTVMGSVAGATYGHLSSVSCVSSTSCFAVGASYNPPTQTKLVERWNGARWSVVASPKPLGASNSQFNSVHCLSSTSCVAVGQYQVNLVTRTLVEQWNGVSWKMVPSPNPAPPVAVSNLASVWCTSTTMCFAVGSYFESTPDSSAERTLVERWDGARWAVVASPNRPSSIDSGLTGVSCTSAASCFAVGHYDTEIVTRTLVERWNGTRWAIVASPNPSGVAQSELSGVSCASTSSCFAVGSGHGTLVEHWNGSSWQMMTSPNPVGATGSSLTAVSCPTGSRCYAAGDFFKSETVSRLVETWNGSGWASVSTPVPAGTVSSGLNGVSCAASANCFAVGEYRLGPSPRPLMDHYA